jgi:hypothetical protein
MIKLRNFVLKAWMRFEIRLSECAPFAVYPVFTKLCFIIFYVNTEYTFAANTKAVKKGKVVPVLN